MNAAEIKKLRKDLGWSQEQLARHLGYSTPTIMKWEQGKTSPKPVVKSILYKLRQELDRRKQKEKEKFVENLSKAIFAGGVIAFIAMLFKED